MKSHGKPLALVLLVVHVAGCGGGSIDAKLAEKAQKIPILEAAETKGKEYIRMGRVDGMSCAWLEGSRPSMEEAELRLQVAALELGAQAIVEERCVEGGVDWKNNCYNTIKCQGEAIKWKKGEAPTSPEESPVTPLESPEAL